MKDTDFQEVLDGALDTIEHIVDTIRETGKRIIDSVMESDPVVTMERWIKEEIPDAIHVIQENGGWAKFFSLMWNVQEMCCNVLKMADAVKWVQDNLPKGANRAVMLALPPQLVTSDRTGYSLHYYVSYLLICFCLPYRLCATRLHPLPLLVIASASVSNLVL